MARRRTPGDSSLTGGLSGRMDPRMAEAMLTNQSTIPTYENFQYSAPPGGGGGGGLPLGTGTNGTTMPTSTIPKIPRILPNGPLLPNAPTGGSYIQNLLNGGAPLVDASEGGSWIDRLLSKDGLADIGRGLGSISQTQASNRGTELDAMMAADNMKLLFDRNQRDSDDHMWKLMRATNYVKGGGAGPAKPMQMASGTVRPMDFGPAPISAADKQVASTLQSQLMERMQNPPEQRDYDSKMKAGTGEKVTGWAGTAMDILGKLFGK
jgi:hypothetical protein